MKATIKRVLCLRRSLSWAARAAVAVFVIWLAFRSVNSINPQFLPRVNIAQDRFQFQIAGL